jgi:hypothetical protein
VNRAPFAENRLLVLAFVLIPLPGCIKNFRGPCMAKYSKYVVAVAAILAASLPGGVRQQNALCARNAILHKRTCVCTPAFKIGYGCAVRRPCGPQLRALFRVSLPLDAKPIKHVTDRAMDIASRARSDGAEDIRAAKHIVALGGPRQSWQKTVGLWLACPGLNSQSLVSNLIDVLRIQGRPGRNRARACGPHDKALRKFMCARAAHLHSSPAAWVPFN